MLKSTFRNHEREEFTITLLPRKFVSDIKQQVIFSQDKRNLISEYAYDEMRNEIMFFKFQA